MRELWSQVGRGGLIPVRPLLDRFRIRFNRGFSTWILIYQKIIYVRPNSAQNRFTHHTVSNVHVKRWPDEHDVRVSFVCIVNTASRCCVKRETNKYLLSRDETIAWAPGIWGRIKTTVHQSNITSNLLLFFCFSPTS